MKFKQISKIFMSIVVGLTSLCLFFACKPDSLNLTLQSFNIRAMLEEQEKIRMWDSRKDALVEHINKQKASIICMQEVKEQQAAFIKPAIEKKYDFVYYYCDDKHNSGGLGVAYDKKVWKKVMLSTFINNQNCIISGNPVQILPYFLFLCSFCAALRSL